MRDIAVASGISTAMINNFIMLGQYQPLDCRRDIGRRATPARRITLCDAEYWRAARQRDGFRRASAGRHEGYFRHLVRIARVTIARDTIIRQICQI